jgi:hypothetical protein
MAQRKATPAWSDVPSTLGEILSAAMGSSQRQVEGEAHAPIKKRFLKGVPQSGEQA